MRLPLLHSLIRRISRRGNRSVRPRRPYFELVLQQLEDRTVPTTFTWQGATNDLWTDPTKWDQGTAPTTGSDVVINNGTTPSYSTTVEIKTLTLSAASGLNVGGGTLTIDAASTLNGAVTLSAGTLAANGTETLAGTTSWTGGTLSASAAASWTNSGTINITGTNNLFLTGTLTNSGTITQTAAAGTNTLNFNSGAVLNNSGLYDVRENGTALTNNGGSGWSFNNLAAGTFQKSGPATAGTATNGTLPFSNAGTVNAKSGTLSLAAVAQDNGGTNTLTGGTWDVFANSTLTFSSGDNLTVNNGSITLHGTNSAFTNIANLATNNGSFTLKDGQSYSSSGAFTNAGSLIVDATGGSDTFTAGAAFTQTGGSTTLVAGGTLSSSIVSVTFSGGKLQGTGTVVGNVTNSGGTVSPGVNAVPLAAGVLSINGKFIQGGGGTLALKVGGTTLPGTNYDQVLVSGTANLAGTISASIFNNYVPAANDVIPNVLHFSVKNGDFTPPLNLALGNNLFLQEQFTPAGNPVQMDLIVHAAPTANAQSMVVGENTAKGITLTGSAPNGDPLSFAVTVSPTHGGLSGTAPNLTYTPGTNFLGGDSFQFTVTDTTTGLTSATATVSISVVAPPTANDQAVTVQQNTPKAITLTGSAPNGDAFTFQVVTGTAHGALSGTAPNLTYTPNNNYTGPDSFTFSVTDTASGLVSNTATVSIVVQSQQVPVANPQSVVVGENTAKVITLTGNAPNGDAFSFQIASQPASGTLSNLNSATGQVTYTPNSNYTGADSFTFTVTDTNTQQVSSPATVSITVVAPPVANPKSVVVGENTAKAVTLTGSAPNGDTFTFQVASNPAHGGLSGTAPNLTYTPNNNYTGADSFTFTVTDTASGLTSTATVSLTVVPPPTANAQSVTVQQNTAKGITLTGSGPNGDSFTFQVSTNPAHGGLSGTAPNLTYTPNNNYTGADSFTFTVTDTASGLTSTATVSITVTAQPTANPQTVVVGENTAKAVTLTGSAPNGDAFTFQVATNPTHGGLSGTAPNLTYTPNSNYTGPDTFTFTVTDTTTGFVSSPATVSLTVVPPPTANAQSVTVQQNTAKGITLTGSAPNGDAFTFQVASNPAHGALSGTAPNLTYTPNNNYTGADSFTFTVTDTASGLTNTATVSITVTAQPTANPQTVVVGENTAKAVTLTGSAPNGDAFTFQVATNPTHGGLSGTAPNLTYTPNANYTGPDSITFTVTDTSTGFVSSPATVSITVVAPPTANPQSVNVIQNTPQAVTLTGSAPNGDAFTFQVATNPAHGALSGSAPNLTYTPNANYTGPDSFTFTVTDTASGLVSSPATVSISVTQTAGSFTYNWNGSTSTDWFTAANWTDTANSGHHAVPTAADAVVITGGNFATVLNANAIVANLTVSNGFLTLNAALEDAGNYFQDQGFVAFGSNADQLILDGTVTRPGGIFLGTVGTVVWNGTAAQTVTDTSGHVLPNLTISNPAGVVLTTGSNLSVQGLGLSPGSALTLAGTATLNVVGSFVDFGTLNLSVLTPNNATVPLTVGHRLTAGNTAVFNLTVGSPASGNVYRFVQFLNLTDNGATYNVTGNGLFSTQVSTTPPFISVTTFAAIYDWNGSTSTDWFTAANWTDVNNPKHHAVPTAVDAAIITSGPNATVLNANAIVANLTISNGFLTLNAALEDAGNYFQDQGFVAFGSNADQLILDGTVTRPGGIFLGTVGTVVWNGTAAQTVTDTSGHALPNLTISNPAGVVLTTGSNLSVQGLGLSPGSALTLAGTATLNVVGSFVDFGTLNLSVLTPNNATVPLTVGHRLTAGNTAVFNLTVGSPASGNVYRFVQFLNLTDNGATYNVTGNGGFDPIVSEPAPFISVTTILGTYRWNGSTSGDWFTAANWTDVNNPNHHAVPGVMDTAVITGGPDATVLSANATIGNLVMANGFLTINANLTDSGTYYQDQGFVVFGSNANQLQIAGNINRPGGIFFGSVGTVVWNGTAAQSVSDTSGHPLPNLTISNPAGVTLSTGSSLGVTGNATLSGMLTLAGTATLSVGGNFSDSGTLNLALAAPGNATAPLVVGGTLTMNAGSVFNLTMGAPFSGAAYLFLQYGGFADNGAQFFFFGQGAFTPTKHENANSLTVTLA